MNTHFFLFLAIILCISCSSCRRLNGLREHLILNPSVVFTPVIVEPKKYAEPDNNEQLVFLHLGVHPINQLDKLTLRKSSSMPLPRLIDPIDRTLGQAVIPNKIVDETYSDNTTISMSSIIESRLYPSMYTKIEVDHQKLLPPVSSQYFHDFDYRYDEAVLSTPGNRSIWYVLLLPLSL